MVDSRIRRRLKRQAGSQEHSAAHRRSHASDQDGRSRRRSPAFARKLHGLELT